MNSRIAIISFWFLLLTSYLLPLTSPKLVYFVLVELTLIVMQVFIRSLIISLILFFAIIKDRDRVFSQEVETTQPPEELERLEYFVGRWRCQQPASPQSPVGIFVWTVKKDLNDFWYVGNATEIELPDGKKPINSREFLGYDTVAQKLLRYVVVGNGNSFNFNASDWQDDLLVWEGVVIEGDSVRALKEEIQQENSDRFTATYFIADRAGKWQPVVDETCERIESPSDREK